MSRRIAAALVVAVAVALAARAVAGGGGDRSGAGDPRPQTVVTRVVDGDTAVLAGLGSSRFIGVDTPEVHGRRECFGAQASAYTQRMLAGRRVRYELGAEPRDRYGRALVYVWLEDGRLFNELLVSAGYAQPLEIEPNVEHSHRFARAARAARRDGRGLWSARATCRPPPKQLPSVMDGTEDGAVARGPRAGLRRGDP